MIEIFQAAGVTQTEKHYSTVRTLIPVVERPGSTLDEEFCTCLTQCIPCLPFFTDGIGTDSYKNDSFELYQNTVSGGTHTIHIIFDDGDEVEVTDNTYGQLYEGVVFWGYRFDAYKIWQDLGAYGGKIQAVIRNYDADNVLVKEEYSPCFRLDKFSARSANKTVVLEFRKKGKLRHGKDYSDLRLTVGVGILRSLYYWPSKLRLPGRLKETSPTIENSEIALSDLTQSRLQILDTMTRNYDLELDLVSENQALPIILDSMFANWIYVTDYNVYNFENYRSVLLKRDSQENSVGVVKRKKIVFKMSNAEKKYEKYND